MHRGWIKFWRKAEDSPVWSMPPLYLKVWIYILMKVDRKTGSIKTTLGTISDRVFYYEWDTERTPDRKTILRILRWLEVEGMIIHESHKRFTKISVVNWALYNSSNSEIATQLPHSVPHSVPQQEQEVHENYKERTLEHMSASADAPVLPGLLLPADNGRARSAEIESIFAHFKSKVHDGARLLDKAKSKIRVRLNNYSIDDLCLAIDHFSEDSWWMENNGRRGMAWFFNSDERIEQFLNLKPRSDNKTSTLIDNTTLDEAVQQLLKGIKE